MTRAAIPDIIDAIRNGDMVVITDDENRENEGDLIVAAERLTTSQMAFMIRYTSGIICLPMEGQRLAELNLPQMVAQNTDRRGTAFTHSIDAKTGITTGISAADRTATVRTVLDPTTTPGDLARPGHIFPLQADAGGVLKRAGHTEAAVDLARLSGLYPAGVLAEVMNEDGSVARMPDLERFAKEHDLLIGTIADLIAYRRSREDQLVDREVEARLPTPYGVFTAVGYRSFDDRNHVAMVMGDIGDGEDILVRAHSECLTGDVLNSMRCDCGQQLDAAMEKIGEEGRGVIVYIRGHEGRGIGLLSKLAAYNLQDDGRDTVEANEELGLPVDARDYGVGAQILYDLGVRSMRLLTNSPTKRAAIEGYGLTIVDRVPLDTGTTEHNRAYLRAKADKLGHLLDMDE